MQTKKLVLFSILLSVSIVLNIVERFAVAGFSGVPFFRLGLANIVILIILYVYGSKDAFTMLILRIFVVGLLTGNLGAPTFWLSLSGGLIAFLLMMIFKQLPGFTIISVSLMGAIGHAFGQILMAIIILSTVENIYLFPLLMVLSVPTGIFTGMVAKKLMRILSQQLFLEQY